MAARDYSQFPDRKQTSARKGSVKKYADEKAGKEHGMDFKTAGWGLKGVKPSKIGWGSDTMSVDTYVTCEGVSHKEGKDESDHYPHGETY